MKRPPVANEIKRPPVAAQDLPDWYRQAEVLNKLNCSFRTLNDNIQKAKNGRGGWPIERRPRTCPGRKSETIYNNVDVDVIVAAKAAPFVMAGRNGTAPPLTGRRPPELPAVRDPELPAVRKPETELTLNALAGMLARVNDRYSKAPSRGRWLTVEEAAAASGLSKSAVRVVAQQMAEAKSPDVCRDGCLKIRRAAVDEIDSAKIREAIEERRRKKQLDAPQTTVRTALRSFTEPAWQRRKM